MKSGLRRIASQQGPPVPFTAAGGRRNGLMFDLGSGRQSLETQMRAYKRSGTVYSIVSLLAQSAAAPTWRLYKKQPVDGRRRYAPSDIGDDQRTEVTVHPAIKLWNAPNSFHTGFEFREGANQHLDLTGETIWVLSREVVAFPTAIWYVRPDRMEPVPDPEGYLVGWIYTSPGGESIPLQLDEVIQERLPDPLDPFRGAGPVASITPNIDQQRYATEYQRNLFLNGADPGSIVTVPNKMTDPEFDEFVDRWRESHQGVARAGRVGVLENGAQWAGAAGATNKDMDYANLRANNRDELREAWRMHKSMLGTVEDVNRANAQTAEEVFMAWSVLPRLDRRRDTLNSKLLPMFGDETVEFDYDDPSPVNQEAAVTELQGKATAAQLLIDAGFDPDDVLETVGLPSMAVAEKATQMPVAPPGWVPAPPAAPAPASGGQSDAGSDQDAATEDAQNRRRITVWGAAQQQQWAGWTLDTRIVAHWAPLLAEAASGALPPARARKIAEDFLAAFPEPPADGTKRQANQNAAGWLSAIGFVITPAIADLLAGLITDAHLAGAASAAAAASGAETASTGTWEPGNTRAAQQVISGLGQTSALATAVAAAPQAAQQVAGTYGVTLGAVLVDGVIAGMGAAGIATAMTTAIAATATASTVVLNHVTQVMGKAAKALYASRGVLNGMWLTEGDDKVDPVCLANAAASPLPLGSAYPSGDDSPPAHVNCRCALLPALGGLSMRYRNGADPATAAYQQQLDDYPPGALAWMHHATFTGPVQVPLTHINPKMNWMDDPDPDHVQDFVNRITKGKKVKPVILVKTPDKKKLLLADGHHRYLAYGELDQPVPAYVATVPPGDDGWKQMHARQYVKAAGHGGGGDNALARVFLDGLRPYTTRALEPAALNRSQP